MSSSLVETRSNNLKVSTTTLTQLVVNTSKDDVYMTVRQELANMSQNNTVPDPADLCAALAEAASRGYFSTCISLLKEGAEVVNQAIDGADTNKHYKLADLLATAQRLKNRQSRNFSLLCSVFVKPSRQNDNYAFNLLRAGADPFFQGGVVYRLALKYRYGTFISVLRQFCALPQLAEHALLGAIYEGDAESVTNLLERRTKFTATHYKAVVRTQNQEVMKAIADSKSYNFEMSDFTGFVNSTSTDTTPVNTEGTSN